MIVAPCELDNLQCTSRCSSLNMPCAVKPRTVSRTMVGSHKETLLHATPLYSQPQNCSLAVESGQPYGEVRPEEKNYIDK